MRDTGGAKMSGQIYLDKLEFPADIIRESTHARAKWIRQVANLFHFLDISSAAYKKKE